MPDNVLFPEGAEEAARKVAEEITGPAIMAREEELAFLTHLGHALVDIDAPPSTEDPLGHSMPKPTREEVDDGEGA